MKKHLPGFSAVLFAVVFTAFSRSNFRVDYIFDFTGNTLISTEVTNPAKWEYVSTNPNDMTCDNINQEACKIRVPASAVNIIPSITLKSTAVISASLYDGPSIDTYYVSGGSSVLAYSNHAQ